MDQPLAQQHLEAVGRYSRQADDLLNSATRVINYRGADPQAIGLQLQAADVYAQLAQASALAAQTAATLPTDDDQEQ